MPRRLRGQRTYGNDGSMTVAAKNPNGLGSVFYEPPTNSSGGQERRGRWRATYTDAAGKTRGMSASTRAEAEARRELRLSAVHSVASPSSRFDRTTTVYELLEWWLETVARHQVKLSTLDSYRRFASYLADGIGARPVVEVDSETLAAWQSDLLDRYAPYTVLNCRKVCRQAFLEAVKAGLIATNPFDLVKAPWRTASPPAVRSPPTRRSASSGPPRTFAWGNGDTALLPGMAGQRSLGSGVERSRS